MALSLTSRKSAHCFVSGKKPDPENPEKFRIQKSGNFDQILRMECINNDFMVKCRSFFVIFTYLSILGIEIS